MFYFSNGTTDSSCKTSENKVFTSFSNKLFHEVRRPTESTNFRDRGFVKCFGILIVKPPHTFEVLELFYVY